LICQEKGPAKHYTESNEAYQLYLKGRFYWNKRTAEALKKSIEYFNQAIEKDPSFTLAYAGLADCYVVPANRLPPREAMPKAKATAIRALELDETLAEARLTRPRPGNIRLGLDECREGIQAYHRAESALCDSPSMVWRILSGNGPQQ